MVLLRIIYLIYRIIESQQKQNQTSPINIYKSPNRPPAQSANRPIGQSANQSAVFVIIPAQLGACSVVKIVYSPVVF